MNMVGERIRAAIQVGPRTATLLANEAGCAVNTANRWVRTYLDDGTAQVWKIENFGRTWIVAREWKPPLTPGTVDSLIVKWSRPADNELTTERQ